MASVARSRRFQQALGRRLRVLDRDLPAALDNDAEALHRTRVASRRLREVLPVIEASSSVRRLAEKNRGRVRKLTRALGGVRELDVALALLDELSAGDPALVAGAAAAALDVRRDRAVRYADMIRRLDEIKPEKLAADIKALANGDDLPPASVQHRRLKNRVSKRAGRLENAIEAAGALYAFDRLHLVRIAAKQLRYALELVGELAGIGTARLVARLKGAQDRLGRLHDLEVLAGYARRTRAGMTDEKTASSASRLLSHIEQETRELHAEYLRGVPMLRAVVDECLGAVAERLA
jgi:CHAD domain-containing protein